MKTIFNIHEFKPINNKTFSYDCIIETIDYVINDTKLFERFTKDFFFYKDMCKRFISYRICNPSVETMVASSIYNENFNRKHSHDNSNDFVENLKSIISLLVLMRDGCFGKPFCVVPRHFILCPSKSFKISFKQGSFKYLRLFKTSP